MLLALKIILGIIALALAFLWFNWTFNTSKMEKQFGVSATNATGKNFIKGDIGGLLGAAAIIIVLFIVQGDVWLLPGLILLGTVVFGRVISLIVDGYSKEGVQALTVELVLAVVILAVAYLR